MSTTGTHSIAPYEWQILKAVRELQFGVVEIVVHDRKVTEVRQTRRTRVSDSIVNEPLDKP